MKNFHFHFHVFWSQFIRYRLDDPLQTSKRLVYFVILILIFDIPRSSNINTNLISMSLDDNFLSAIIPYINVELKVIDEKDYNRIY